MNTVLQDTLCYHCGETLPPSPFVFEDKSFCCLGCERVYQLLSENQLCQYYVYNPNPGKQQASSTQFHYLEDDEVVRQLLDYAGAERNIVTFYIPSIHCSSCIYLLEHLYKIHPGIYNSRIDFMKRQVTISFKPNALSLKQVVEILANIGYEPLISLQDVVKAGKKQDDKQLVRKIAVAGFCMGNVMLFSFPEYLGLSSLEQQFQHLFGYLNVAFSIPVTFYCAKEFFVSAYTSLKHKVINLDAPLALIIAVLFLRTLVEVLVFQGPGFADTLTGLVFLLLMGRWVKLRSYHHIAFDRDYRSYFPIAVTTLIEGREKACALSELKVGDRVLLRNGELLPADAILMKGDAWMDMSFVTGEAEAVHQGLGEIIYAGGRQMAQAIELEVVKPVSQSYLTGLWNQSNYNSPTQQQNFNDSIARYFSVAVFIIAFASAGFWYWQSDPVKAWSAFTAVIIVACPCVVALSTPFSLSAILSVFDKKGFYVKSTDVLERLAQVDHIVFDKTGTLSSSMNADMQFQGVLSPYEERLLASLLRNSSHPLSRQILRSLNQKEFSAAQDFQEFIGQGLQAQVDQQMVQAGSAQWLSHIHQGLQAHGVHIAINGIYKGCFSASQQWRPNLANLVQDLAKNHQLHVLSGDGAKDHEALRKLFPVDTHYHFQQSPMQKLEYIQSLQQAGKQVLMLGDGLNDAGALKQSDCGIAITEDINNFSPGCDAILEGKSMVLMPQFIAMSKRGMKIIKIAFLIATTYNLVGIYFAVQGTLYPLIAAVLMPVSTLTIITFTSLALRYSAKKTQLR